MKKEVYKSIGVNNFRSLRLGDKSSASAYAATEVRTPTGWDTIFNSCQHKFDIIILPAG